MRTFVVTPTESRERLDRFLFTRIPALSRARIQCLIEAGLVRINGAIAKPSAKLRAGDLVEASDPPTPDPVSATPEPIPLSILYEDDDIVVLDKPPGLVVHPGAGHRSGTLVHALLHHCLHLSGIGGETRPGIVHRLDKDTSGCIVAAKNDVAHIALAKQFAGRSVTKIYLAIARGHPRKSQGRIEAPIGRHPIHRKRMAVVERGRPAATDYRVLAFCGPHVLIECTLHTGRTHQIRVHLKHLGHPICGDREYGGPADFPRQMLHAWKLGFLHPRNARRLDFTSPPPPDFIHAGVRLP